MAPVVVLSHRGRIGRRVPGASPDNTIAAFRTAAARGVIGFETDVRLSADGVPVLFHDAELADGTRLDSVASAELSERATLAVPTLAEALAVFPEHIWDVELKTEAAVGPTAAVIAASAARARVWTSSFIHSAATACGQAAEVPFAWLVGEPPSPVAPLLRRAVDAGARGLVWHARDVGAATVAAARELGLETWVHGMGSARAHARVLALDPTGVITDTPAYVTV